MPKPIRPSGAGLANLVLPISPQKIIINMVKWLNPRQFYLTGRGIIMGGIDAVYDLTGVKLKNFLSFPLDGCRCDPIL
ncbi:hypothetical protein ACYKVK_001175 [Enterobacter hormaechei]|uniref:hypothetical protein n=1 Tax=Enterobacter hormaechei TaxID=158836 RepID=UPI001C5E35EF|nr:hypothetical protein [Enterobacter hormaechei]WDC55118.1 hypothetical protein PTC84_23270 [Enterobacter hormaechei]HDU8957554.1 hypothetical protein [Enterobacter hormaechei]